VRHLTAARWLYNLKAQLISGGITLEPDKGRRIHSTQARPNFIREYMSPFMLAKLPIY